MLYVPFGANLLALSSNDAGRHLTWLTPTPPLAKREPERASRGSPQSIMATTIANLLRDERANVNVILSLDDLREFVNELLENGSVATPAPVEVQRSKELMTRDEVCEYLGVTKPTLHRWNKMGYLTCIKVGSKVRYRREDVESFAVK